MDSVAYLLLVDLFNSLCRCVYAFLLSGHHDLVLVDGGRGHGDPGTGLFHQVLGVLVVRSTDEGVVDLLDGHAHKCQFCLEWQRIRVILGIRFVLCVLHSQMLNGCQGFVDFILRRIEKHTP